MGGNTRPGFETIYDIVRRKMQTLPISGSLKIAVSTPGPAICMPLRR